MNPAKGLASAGLLTFALSGAPSGSETVMLPSVQPGDASLDDALLRRRSVRELSPRELPLETVARLCWAAQGITDPVHRFRTAPSAGALYPLELYVVAPNGVFRYDPIGHRLARRAASDARAALARAAFDQAAVRDAGIDLVLTAAVARTRAKYGERAERYAALEAGHAAQNVLLEATALGLGAVPVGAFDDATARRVVVASEDETPLYVIAVGHPR